MLLLRALRACILIALSASAACFAGAARAGSWHGVAPLPVDRGHHTTTLLSDGRVLAAGGVVGGTTGDASAVIYDPATNLWSSTGSLNQARLFHTAVRLSDGRVLVSGGYRVSRGFFFALGSSEIYDPATGRWTSTGSLSEPRHGHTATLLHDGRVLALGGQNQDTSYIAAVEIYDPANGAWTRVGAMPAPTLGHTATVLPSGKVLVVGGSNDAGVLSASYLFDPMTNQWVYAGDVGQRTGHTATIVATSSGGIVLVAGGGAGSPFAPQPLSSTIAYSLNGGGWGQAAAMLSPHSGHFAVRLRDGRVFVAGGFRPPAPELYDGASNRWTVDAQQPMIDGPAALLLDGTVLVAGGIDYRDQQIGSYTREANVYVPDALPQIPVAAQVPVLSTVSLFALATTLAALAAAGVRLPR